MKKRERLSKGYVQLYTGDGKGKTTAALGQAVRAAGRGFRTYIGQFMKGQRYGELEALRDHPLITLEQYGGVHHVFRDTVTKDDVAKANQGLTRAREMMLSGDYDIIVLDEVNVSIWFGLLETEDILAFVDEKPEHVELILTGRRAPEALIQRADLVTEMRQIKHYYEQGVTARVGIER